MSGKSHAAVAAASSSAFRAISLRICCAAVRPAINAASIELGAAPNAAADCAAPAITMASARWRADDEDGCNSTRSVRVASARGMDV